MIRTVSTALSALMLLAWTGTSPAQDFFGDRKPVKKPSTTTEKPKHTEKARDKRQPVKKRAVKKPRVKKDPGPCTVRIPPFILRLPAIIGVRT